MNEQCLATCQRSSTSYTQTGLRSVFSRLAARRNKSFFSSGNSCSCWSFVIILRRSFHRGGCSGIVYHAIDALSAVNKRPCLLITGQACLALFSPFLLKSRTNLPSPINRGPQLLMTPARSSATITKEDTMRSQMRNAILSNVSPLYTQTVTILIIELIGRAS